MTSLPRPAQFRETGPPSHHHWSEMDLETTARICALNEYEAQQIGRAADEPWPLEDASDERPRAQQARLYYGYTHHWAGFNLAANPDTVHPDGTVGSKHGPQGASHKGFAMDLHRGPGSPAWHIVHGDAHGFGLRFPVHHPQVEPWHCVAYAKFVDGAAVYLAVAPEREAAVQRWRDFLRGRTPDPSAPAKAKGLEAELPTRILRRGSAGYAVEVLQRLLNRTGVMKHPLGIDGRYGGAVEKAVEQLQHNAGITEDGIYGPDTRAALKSQLQIQGGSQ